MGKQKNRAPDSRLQTSGIADELSLLRHELETLGDTLSAIREDIQWAAQNLCRPDAAEISDQERLEFKRQLVDARQVIIDLLSSKKLNEQSADTLTLRAVASAIGYLRGASMAKRCSSADADENPAHAESAGSETVASSNDAVDRSNGFLF